MNTHETVAPTVIERQELSNEGALLRISLDAAPLEVASQTLKDGETADVLARLRTIEGNNSYKDNQAAAELLVLRDQRGNIAFRALNPYGETITTVPAKRSYKTKFQEIRTSSGAPDVNVLFSAPKKGEESAPVLTIAKPFSYTKMRVTAHEGAARLAQPGETQHSLSESNRHKKSGRVRKWLAGLALVGATAAGTDATGGLYDMIGDSMSDAGTSVEHDFTGATPDEQAAINRVAHTMEDLDNHNNDAIDERADEFKQKHQNEFVSDETIARAENNIEQAKTAEAVISTMDTYLEQYDKHAAARQENTKEGVQFDPNKVPLDIFKQYALGVIDAYSFLPKNMVKEANFSTLEFASPAIDQETGRRADVDGLYIYGDDSKSNRLMLVVSNDYGAGTRARSSEVTLHETGHANDKAIIPDESTGQELDGTGSFKYFLKYLVDKPDNVSTYAEANGHNEQYAEDNAHLLVRGDNNALAHPDDIRLFNSPANRQLLRLLIQDDEKFPGIADYIVQHSGVEKRQNNLFNF